MSKIPADAKKVFEAYRFDIYEKDLVQYDGSVGTFSWIKWKNYSYIFPVVGDKIIVTQETQPHKGTFYSFIGGRLEGDEDPLESAKRELLEEAGLVSDEWVSYHDASTTFAPDERTCFMWIAKNCQRVSDIQDLDAGEKVELIPLDFDSFVEYCIEKGQIIQPQFPFIKSSIDQEEKEKLRNLLFG